MFGSHSTTVDSIILRSSQALEYGQLCVHKARHTAQRFKESAEQVERAHTKLTIFSEELRKQMQVTTEMISKLKEREGKQLEIVRNNHVDADMVQSALQAIFDRLKARPVDAALAQEDYKSLYDFVDTDAVDGLRKDLFSQMDSLQKVQEEGTRLVEGMESYLGELNVLRSSDPQTAAPDTQSMSQQITQQAALLQSMSATLLTITSHYDRTMHVLRHQETRPADVADLEERTLQVAALSKSLEASLDSIVVPCNELATRSARYQMVYSNVHAVFKRLEAFGASMKQTLPLLYSIEERFQEQQAVLAAVLDELSSLVTWYNLFEKAYDQLLLEVPRRVEEQRRQQRVVESMQRELDQLHQGEAARRERFHDMYGRFLPVTLCDAIQDEAPHFVIHPTPSLESRLPTLGVHRASSSAAAPASVQQSGTSSELLRNPPHTHVATSHAGNTSSQHS